MSGFWKKVGIGLIFFLAAGTNLCLAQHDYIDITNPSLKKIPIVIPLIRTAPAGETSVSVKAADQFAHHLGFTGYFKVLDRKPFTGLETDELTLDFGKWTAGGAELLVTGNIVIADGLAEVEFRLFDTFKEQLLIGKRYKGWVKDMPRIVRRFCSEIVHHLTGNWGIFDTQIAFVSTGTGTKEIYLCDFDGSNSRRFTRNNSIALSPAWSSDAKWIAYTSFARGRPDLYIRNISGKSGAVVSKKGINTTPAWVPGKFMLAATLSFSGDQDIYLLSGQGKMVRKLTKKWSIDTSPSWSPDGKQFAFVSNRSGSPQIYMKNTGSGRVERITFQGRYNTQPAWSPRGDQIAYSAMERGGEINIHVIDLKTMRSARLTYSAGKNESPAWSPDGSLIAFSSTREGGNSRIYIMTAFGTEQRRLMRLPGQQSDPAWSPRIGNP
ncbi:Tol-Pal system beta propeller repeat protein Tol B [Desulfonema ishimotonii]|uniref:Tol-Pal system beta propeller repeat protein Tol B n=1 Tax=Desulfonema ishimotonii TaxID=45657 RepID=A0A401FX38_9BACT|nr:Tol-Pal system beta propeller repeat protein TolB [Desulfonema ishimotonii]GBC61525.1 Tol-Pal system beta propeller repeat protein Tol B [Desulfonema ishimotonii]